MSGQSFADSTIRRFAAHETFPPRFGWLRKALMEVVTDCDVPRQDGEPGASDVFIRNTAPVDLGVGKNMVNAMRYWTQAFGITTESTVGKGSRALLARPTARGLWLLGPAGVDPWLEDPASLWILHWWLLQPPSLAPTWWAAFNAHPGPRFVESELVAHVEKLVSTADWDPVATTSIAKDVDCLTKMYAPRRSTSGAPGTLEDLLDCPFRELGLLEAVPDSPHTWRFAAAPRLAAPAAIVAYAAIDFLAQQNSGASITLSRLAHEPGGVGRAFRLPEPAIASALASISTIESSVRLSDSIGSRSLVIDGNPEAVRDRVVERYYRRGSNGQPSADLVSIGGNA